MMMGEEDASGVMRLVERSLASRLVKISLAVWVSWPMMVPLGLSCQ